MVENQLSDCVRPVHFMKHNALDCYRDNEIFLRLLTVGNFNACTQNRIGENY